MEGATAMADKEISITTEGIVLKGDVVDDVRVPLKRLSGTADAALRLLENIVRVPMDFASNGIERFRLKYAERFEEIPLANRQEPPRRIGAAVLKHVTYAEDEPDIQDLFANLLATASNSETVHHVHPGFATVISEMRATDALVLRRFGAGQGRGYFGVDGSERISEDVYQEAIANLVRLGLLDWRMRRAAISELKAFEPKSYGLIRPEQQAKLLVDLVREVQRLKATLGKQLEGQHQRVALELTSFGRHFLAAVAEPEIADEEARAPHDS